MKRRRASTYTALAGEGPTHARRPRMRPRPRSNTAFTPLLLLIGVLGCLLLIVAPRSSSLASKDPHIFFASEPNVLLRSALNDGVARKPAEDAYIFGNRDDDGDNVPHAVTAIPSGKILRRITLGTVAGENCNRLLAIGVGIALAMQNHSQFVLWGGWRDTVARDLDVEQLSRFAGAALAIEDDMPRDAEVLHDDAQEQIWCGSKASLSAIRHGMRPKRTYQDEAEQALREMRAKGAQTIVALHGRNQRRICRKRTDKYPDFCHEDSVYECGFLHCEARHTDTGRYRTATRSARLTFATMR